LIARIVTIVTALVLAGSSAFAVVANQSKAEPVKKPLVVYGNR
jgi:hypothetical protein